MKGFKYTGHYFSTKVRELLLLYRLCKDEKRWFNCTINVLTNKYFSLLEFLITLLGQSSTW